MTHQTSSIKTAPLAPIPCSNCGDLARMVGLEPALGGGNLADLCTYECESCGAVQTRVFARRPGEATGGGRAPFNGNGSK